MNIDEEVREVIGNIKTDNDDDQHHTSPEETAQRYEYVGSVMRLGQWMKRNTQMYEGFYNHYSYRISSVRLFQLPLVWVPCQRPYAFPGVVCQRRIVPMVKLY